MMELLLYAKKIFCSVWTVGAAVVLSKVWQYLFPVPDYEAAAVSVIIIMALDVLTKLYALSVQSKGLCRAFKEHVINSHSFMRGTLDKLILFGIVLIICGAAYRLFPMQGIAITITQTACIAMFLRDALSVLENLSDAGVKGLGVVKNIFKKKLDELCEDTDNESEEP
jgi:phage-related holin